MLIHIHEKKMQKEGRHIFPKANRYRQTNCDEWSHLEINHVVLNRVNKMNGGKEEYTDDKVE